MKSEARPEVWPSADPDQASAAADQSASHADQKFADDDQTTSDADQLSSATDQLASDQDQATANREYAAKVNPTPTEKTSFKVSRHEREKDSVERQQNRLHRGRTTRDRDVTADRRVRNAGSRDDRAADREATKRPTP